MKIEDKAYFAISPAETEKKIRDLTAAWRKLMNVADNLHGMANPSPEIIKRQDQVDADMERVAEEIAALKKSIGVQENVSVRLAKPVEDKAYFEKRIEVETWKSPKGTTYIAGLNQGSSGLFQPFIIATYSDGGQQLMTGNPPKFKTEGGARKWLSAEITRRKTPNARQGSKVKFANRGAFAEASSSPVLGSLLEKKVMPEGGWRAVETDGGALVIAFEDGDIAGNFARRASENGYSATAPMAMAGRYWNVKVQNENKN